MRFYNPFALFALSLCLLSCGNGKELKSKFRLTTNLEKNTGKFGDKMQITLTPKGDVAVDSVQYYLGEEKLVTVDSVQNINVTLDQKKLGKKLLTAKIFVQGKTAILEETVTVLAKNLPKLYKYELVAKYPHDVASYTQGLEFRGDTLYESAGQYGESRLLTVDYKTGKIDQEVKLADEYFAEGLTVINNKVVLLTWRENVGFVYDAKTLEKESSFKYNQSKQGWGLCNDGEKIYKSDGTEKIWILNPETFAEEDYIQIVDNKKLRSKYNELEWVNGKIYGNTYQNDGISIINPETGAIEALVDLRPLKNEVQSGLDEANEVLNGIAYHRESDRLFVTGKHWNTLFEIKIIK